MCEWVNRFMGAVVMSLADIGYDPWVQRKREEFGKPELSAARITRVDRDRYLVRNEEREVQGEPTGRLLFSAGSNEEIPCVGDWVLVQYYNEGSLAIIHDVLTRRTFLRRKAAGKRIEYQMIAANIDVAFVMQSCDADFNIRRLERYLVMAAEGRIEPVLVLSKSDLIGDEQLEAIFEEIRQARIEVQVMALSNTTGRGYHELRETLTKGRTYCLLGSSGVGKTTLLNRLRGEDEFETADVREKDGKGRHTTTRRQLSILDNGALLVDTPGMRELGIADAGAGIDESFSDILGLAESCRFKDCTHGSEKGCAVAEALKNGDLDEDRYQSYLKLRKEAAFYQLSYVERRKRDKQFGRMINVALKELRKRKPSV